MRSTDYSSTLAISRVSFSSNSFVVTERSVLRMNFFAEKPANSKPAKR